VRVPWHGWILLLLNPLVMELRHVSTYKGFHRYELYKNGVRELYIETKLSAKAAVEMLFHNFGITDVKIL
jgi:hypothetical protein